MRFLDAITDEGTLKVIGSRLLEIRLAKDLTQEEVAREAGIGLRTLQRMEAGEVASRLSGFVGVCRVLGLGERFEMLLPAPRANPMDQLKLQGKKRERASGLRKAVPLSLKEDPGPWKWGDEK